MTNNYTMFNYHLRSHPLGVKKKKKKKRKEKKRRKKKEQEKPSRL